MAERNSAKPTTIALPSPRLAGKHPLERVIARRRSIRELGTRPLSLQQAGQLLWSAQGITAEGGLRAAPSAGALYPLEAYLVAGAVEGLAPGVYRYRPRDHRLLRVGAGDRRASVTRAALNQRWMGVAPAMLVLTAIYSRTAVKYGDRAERYVHIEVGHAAQNVYLQATALGLGTTFVGAFDDERVAAALGVAPPERVLAILPIGWQPRSP